MTKTITDVKNEIAEVRAMKSNHEKHRALAKKMKNADLQKNAEDGIKLSALLLQELEWALADAEAEAAETTAEPTKEKIPEKQEAVTEAAKEPKPQVAPMPEKEKIPEKQEAVTEAAKEPEKEQKPEEAPKSADELFKSALKNMKDEKTAEAAVLLKEAAAKGHSDSMLYLLALRDGGIIGNNDADIAATVESYEKAVDESDWAGLFALGKCYFDGAGTPKDLEKALKALEKAAAVAERSGKTSQQGFDDMENMLAKCYEEKGETEKALYYYEKSASHDGPEPIYQLSCGLYYVSLFGKTRNMKFADKAHGWINKAIDNSRDKEFTEFARKTLDNLLSMRKDALKLTDCVKKKDNFLRIIEQSQAQLKLQTLPIKQESKNVVAATEPTYKRKEPEAFPAPEGVSRLSAELELRMGKRTFKNDIKLFFEGFKKYAARKKVQNIARYSGIDFDITTYLFADGDWIYYENIEDGRKLYRMRIGGGEKQKLINAKASYITIAGDRICYKNLNDDGKLYCMRTDGSDERRLSDRYFVWSNIEVVGNWVYFKDNKRLYRLKIFG